MSHKSWSELRDMLRQYRDDSVRQSQDVVDMYEELAQNVQKLGDEQWLVLEQVTIAALDVHNMDLANNCLIRLNDQFPGSNRVRKLKAMRLEALGRYEEALLIIDNLIAKDETNASIRKRKVAIFKAQNKFVEAIKELTDYLKIFMADQEAWLELCDLYLEQQDLSKAAFCMEEVILHNPHNPLFLQRYGDIKYTQGGYDNWEMARAYYVRAAQLQKGHIRSLYGVLLCCTQIMQSPKCPSLKKKECVKLAEWASKELSQQYADVEGETENLSPGLEGLISALQIKDS
uniref:ER membrane protein complex subunit 2 n=1 Tax=Lynceus sp. MCZ IZ 141354 TaxID=1930659 RepID=A0A9N6WTD5_9CRUS|nr:EOG090X0CGE [Lynceus sp. MCZ IZ 141354]